MATLDYGTRLANLQARRYDSSLNESAVSKLFSRSDVPSDIKYLVESMLPIEKKYNDKTELAADRVKNHLEENLSLHFGRDYRTQGSVITGTNIKVHSDFDLLTLINKYYYPQTQPTTPYTGSDPDEDIKDLRLQAIKVLKNIYDEVDTKQEKCISIYNKSLHRKVDIVFAYWYNSDKYEELKSEYYRGIYLYKFPNGPKNPSPDYPFAHISQVNYKGEVTNDGSRRGIRLLKTLRADSDFKMDMLKGFHITSMIHLMDDEKLIFHPGNELELAINMSQFMDRFINDEDFRKTSKSPNGIERPFRDDRIVPEINSLKTDLDTLIVDSKTDFYRSESTRKAILTS